jgi:hypothetical protein
MSFGCDVVVSSVTAVGRGWEGGRRLSGVRSCGTARETGAREVIAEGWRRGMRREKEWRVSKGWTRDEMCREGDCERE